LAVTTEPLADGAGELEVLDISAIPAEPPPELFYTHRPSVLRSIVLAWRRRDVMFTLAERDIRVSYKQQFLGVAWSAITPLMTLIIFSVLLRNQSGFQSKYPTGATHLVHGHLEPVYIVVPYAVATFAGLWSWGLFSGALGGASGSLVGNKVLMARTHFPRECFPLSQFLESVFGSTVSLLPFALVLGVYTYAPRITSLWVPLYLVIELPFIFGVVLLVSAIMVQARDLTNVLPIMTQFAMLASPVVWPWTRLTNKNWPLVGHNLVYIYSVINPLGPVINDIRGSVLGGVGPTWGLLGISLASGIVYFMIGYRVFKKLEVNFADVC
jgi:ABC-type polysaccharide/polyol phosphate export permease